MKFDLHIHTCYSQDAYNRPDEIAHYLKKKGFHGMAITDHNTVKGAVETLKTPIPDFMIIPGCEISTQNGHMLALGITESVKKGLTPQETIDRIHTHGGIAIIPHPFRFSTGMGKRYCNVEAIETFNGRSFYWDNERARKLASHWGLGGTGGSDAHYLEEAGTGYTLIDEGTTRDDILTEIEKGRSRGAGENRFPLRYPFTMAISFAKRGFKRI